MSPLALWVGLVILLAPLVGEAASPGHSVVGVVLDSAGNLISGASVVAGESRSTTDVEGRFALQLTDAVDSIRISHPNYLSLDMPVPEGAGSEEIEVRLESMISVSETIQVDAIRAADPIPITKTNIDADEIEAMSHGQDAPSLLQATPSMTWYSDSGTGSGYSYFSMRGISQTRINMTLDGAPLNDPAEHALYFNNFYDFTSAVDSIQIQRGVGTSSVGAPSFGGSVNFASAPLAQEREMGVRLGFGSFDTQRASLVYESGTLDNGLAFSGRVSLAESDGYREHSGTRHDTVFFNAAWQGEKSQLKWVSFSGRERSQLSFYAVDPETLRTNPRFNPMAEEERDRFQQDFAQLQYVRALGERKTLVASLYYNGANGWFRLWDDPVAKNDLLQFGIDQYFVGSTVNLGYSGERFSATVGANVNDFRGDHTLDVGEQRIYRNTGLKRQANGFAKVAYDRGAWLLYGDLQLRWAEFDYRGDIDLDAVDWLFLDPKVGVRYRISPSLSLYGSIGTAEREPTRLDLLSGEDNATVVHDLEAVEPERVFDIETGLNLNTSNLALQFTLYSMEFSNEIAATGELSEIGLPLRVNVDESYRRGIEIDLRWAIDDRWTLTHTANLSRNRIKEWTQFYDVYDPLGNWQGSEPRVHRDVPPLLTPEVVINQGVEWSNGGSSVALSGRWVDDSHLDNTGNPRFRAPSYITVGLRGSLSLERWPVFGDSRLNVHIDNLLDEEDHYPSGYSYLFLNRDDSGQDALNGISYFYPQANRSVTVTLDLGF